MPRTNNHEETLMEEAQKILIREITPIADEYEKIDAKEENSVSQLSLRRAHTWSTTDILQE